MLSHASLQFYIFDKYIMALVFKTNPRYWRLAPDRVGSHYVYHQLGDVDTSDEASNTIISIFQATPVQYPLRVTMMERHPLGSQAFMPLLGNPYLILVAQLTGDLETDKLNPENIRGFISNGKQGVNYHKGV